MAEIEIGSILEGKITGIMKFGAFVALPGGKSGLVHISEVANAFVSDINEHVQIGQTVKVLVLSIAPDGKISLSIKKAAAPAEQPNRRSAPVQRENSYSRQIVRERTAADPPTANQEFEDRLKKFMQESDSRIADNRIYSDHRQRGRRR